jgi:hypothetical protein
MTTRRVDSLPEPNGNLTRLLVDVPEDGTFPRMHIRYVEGGTTVRQLLLANIASLFRIRFHRFDLAAKRMFWGYLDYAPRANPVMDIDGVRKITLTYANVEGQWIVDSRPAWLPLDVPDLRDLAAPDKINVTVTIEAETAPHSAGWINFDIAHSYPQQPVAASSATVGYEQTILFPFFTFAESNPGSFAEPITGPLQFSSIYKITLDSELKREIAEGMILHVDDVDGHQTSATYNKTHHIFHQTLRNSMHLQGARFVRAADYQLSRPNPFGFGGNGIRYRLRGFRQSAATAGVPVGWYEPAHLYREWLKARFPAGPLFTKHRPNRPKNAPVDTMSPHTVVQNWGLDGAADSKPHKLEMHPLIEQEPNDENRPSFPHVAAELKGLFPAVLQVKPEIQAWGIEKAGFYQFICGYPHLANLIHGAGTFKNGVAQVTARGGVIAVTTDPASMIFDRKRYAGHIRPTSSGWVPILDEPFPAAVRNNTCAVTQLTDDGKEFKRLWVVDGIPEDGIPPADDAATLRRSQKVTEWGELSAGPPVIGGGFYRASGKQICPTTEAAGLYLDKWVGLHLFNQDVRIVEYMKSGAGGFFCFDTTHDHIPGHNDTRFNKVIGFGSWYVRRIKSIFEALHARGAAFDNQAPCSFRLSHEFEAPEQLIPYIDQYYNGSELYNFVYSHLATPMMGPGRDLGGIHPNYRETAIAAAAPPAYMLDPARDDDPVLDERKRDMTQEQLDALHEERDPHFTRWRDEAVNYGRAAFPVAEWGNAPRNYPVEGMGSKPIRNYSYSRCIQDAFNLRASIFENGAAAVRGLRIMIPSAWLEPPLEYNAAALQHAVLASRLQSRHKDFFRFGRMLGETLVTVNGQPPRKLCAWNCGPRSFMDVAPLVDLVGAHDPQLGAEWRNVRNPMHDFISRGWDKQSDCDVLLSEQIHHRVWEHVAGNGVRRVLYAFANLGNRPVTIHFVYGRGLEGATGRSRTIAVNDGAPSAPRTISLGEDEDLAMPRRSFAAVVIE